MTGAKLGILVGGGPAPGINSVISSATIEAITKDVQVVGILNGFHWLCRNDASHVADLDIPRVSRIHFDGGSILRTARDNPAASAATMSAVAEALTRLDLDYLVTIGGDDTAYSANRVSEVLRGKLRVAHVPKTIDNDIPLPGTSAPKSSTT